MKKRRSVMWLVKWPSAGAGTGVEKDSRLGGLMYYVGRPDFKIDCCKYTEYLIYTLKMTNVEIRMNTSFTLIEAEKENYDEIIAATGSEWYLPNIPGIKESNILNPLEVLDDHYPSVDHFLIASAGLVGCETAMHLAEKGKKVTMIDIVPNSNPANLYGVDWNINARLAADHVDVELDKKILSMSSATITCAAKKNKTPHNMNTSKGTEKPYDFSGPYDGGKIKFKGDAVICAIGMRSVNGVAKQLINAGYPVEMIGDAVKPRKLLDAVHEGYNAGRRA